MVNKKKHVHNVVPKVLGYSSIKNPGSKKAEFDEAFSYVDYSYLYWGQGQAIIKALNTSIRLSDGTRMPNISWGIPHQSNVTKVHT